MEPSKSSLGLSVRFIKNYRADLDTYADNYRDDFEAYTDNFKTDFSLFDRALALAAQDTRPIAFNLRLADAMTFLRTRNT